jgi:uncharacterized protein (TIGR04255 family)
MPLRYQKPPLIEALCEFRFESSSAQPWDGAVPGLMYAKLGARYPKRDETVALDLAQPGSLPRPRSRFFSPDKARLVQLGPDMLVVNALEPHLGWAGLRDEACRVLSEYREVARPARLRTVILRYINRVDVSSMVDVALEDYFTTLPSVPEGMSAPLSAFSIQAEARYEEPDAALRFNLRTLNGTEDQLSFLVDYEHASLDASAPEFDAVPVWLDAAHSRIELAFYGTFTPACHAEIFQEARGE